MRCGDSEFDRIRRVDGILHGLKKQEMSPEKIEWASRMVYIQQRFWISGRRRSEYGSSVSSSRQREILAHLVILTAQPQQLVLTIILQVPIHSRTLTCPRIARAILYFNLNTRDTLPISETVIHYVVSGLYVLSTRLACRGLPSLSAPAFTVRCLERTTASTCLALRRRSSTSRYVQHMFDCLHSRHIYSV